MHDIITFGSGTYDIFLKPSDFKVISDKKFVTGRGICFNLGSKVDVTDVKFSSGGGGTNSAATFTKQGFSVAFCGKLGNDIMGNEIIKELKDRGVNTNYISKSDKRRTNQSVVINADKKDRTIFVYRGASELLEKTEILWEHLDAKWFYIAPLSGKLAEIFPNIVNFAKEKGIKVAANLGNSQLKIKKDILKKTLEKIDVLILNQEEASILTKTPFEKEAEVFKKIDAMCPGITIMTKGDKGVSVSDGWNIYKAVAVKTKIVDKTGAGDAFGSGFVSKFILSGGNIEESIQFGVANATSCIRNWGAKGGLLEKDARFEKVKIKKQNCSKSNLCKIKS